MEKNTKIPVDEKLLSNVGTLKELVTYQDTSIVSRTLINKGVGTVTVFAFDKGQSLSPHSAPYDAVVYCVEGYGQVIIDNKVNEIQEGGIIIMPANIPHAVVATERFKMMLIMVKE